MSKAILGKKLGMTQVFTAEGQLVPVTVVEATPSVVVRVKLLNLTVMTQCSSVMAPSKKNI